LVDSNAAAGNDNRSQDISSTQPAPPRRADDRPPAADTRLRDSDTASDRIPRNDRDDRDTANAPRDDAGAGAGSADTAGRTQSKSAASKPDEAKSALKSPSEDNASLNDSTEAKQDGPVATTGDAVAAVIATAAAAIDVPAATAPASGKATVPLVRGHRCRFGGIRDRAGYSRRPRSVGYGNRGGRKGGRRQVRCTGRRQRECRRSDHSR
jgi:hypothetical protein